jgi:hypothetical protein
MRHNLEKPFTKTALANWLKVKTMSSSPHNAKNDNNKFKKIQRKRKTHPTVHCLQETHFTTQEADGLKVKRLKEVFLANANQTQGAAAAFTPDKTDFKSKSVRRDKDTI